MNADPQTTEEVVSAINYWMQIYASRDLDALMALFSSLSEIVVIGTGSDEKRIGAEEARLQFARDFMQCESIRAVLGWHSVSVAANTAWIAADTVFQVTTDGQENTFPLRLTAVLERCGDRWLIAQWHVSAPAAGQSEGSSW